jgi:hypothetical protein
MLLRTVGINYLLKIPTLQHDLFRINYQVKLYCSHWHRCDVKKIALNVSVFKTFFRYCIPHYDAYFPRRFTCLMSEGRLGVSSLGKHVCISAPSSWNCFQPGVPSLYAFTLFPSKAIIQCAVLKKRESFTRFSLQKLKTSTCIK